MINRIRHKLEKHEFARHVLTLMTGSGLGQLIALFLSPVVARFYSPEDFSTLEQFAMMLAVLAVFSTGKYEFAIMLTKTRERARHLVILTLSVALVFSLLILVALLFSRHLLASWYNNPELATWILFLPIAIMGFAIFNVFNYWFSREKKYKIAAKARMLNSAVNEPSKVVFGLAAYTGGGLVLGVILGRLTTSWFLLRSYLKDPSGGFGNLSWITIKEVALEYKNYPLFNTWSSFFGRLAQWSHIFLFSYFFGIWTIGFFALTRRVIQNPLNILANSYGQVFYQRISAINDSGDLKRFYFKNILRFLLLAALMVIVVLLLPSNTMSVVFGERWGESIDFLKILVFWYALNFVTGSLSFINHKLQKQRAMLVLDVLHFTLVSSSIVSSFYLGNDAMETLTFFVVAKVVFYVINMLSSMYFVLHTPIPQSE